MKPKILITGGAGYIGSHTCIELLAAGFELVVIDNLSNSKRESLRRVEEISGTTLIFVETDVRNKSGLEQVFAAHSIDAVIHFAGLKAVGESVEKPLKYYDVNVTGSLVLLEVMAAANVKTLVFSSSATVYGDPHAVPICEDFPLTATNPYGRSKLMIEDILRDVYRADPSWHIGLLRYFNPVGAHPSGKIGEDPSGIPNNLMPIVAQVACGKRDFVSVYGNDYNTQDGTGVRDYIHVMDLARGHVKALNALNTLSSSQNRSGLVTLNLGTGTGYSVLDVVKAFEAASGRAVPYKIAARRPGDVAECFADPALAAKTIGWRAELGLDEMCADAWRWQNANPNGFT